MLHLILFVDRSDTFTDVSSYQGDADSLYRSNGRASGGYEERDDDLDSFKMPDFSVSVIDSSCPLLKIITREWNISTLLTMHNLSVKLIYLLW